MEKKLGIDKISFYIPQYKIDQETLAVARGIPVSKIQKGLGQYSMSVIPPWEDVITILPYFTVCFVIIFVFRKELDLLRLSEDEAKMLGGNPRRTYFIVLTASSLLTAVAVSLSGLIAFVGLVIPHILRLTVSSSYRIIIPLSALVGGSFLTIADTFSRTVISPSELPIGIVTAFIGAPFFAFLLKASKGSF